MQPILEIHHLSKKFRIAHDLVPYLSFRERIQQMLHGRKTHSSEEFWALNDVSFQVFPGESVGIIGRNGAGKSTLLKILSKITPPTKGKIISRGRISSLLEVGTGFHPELTGRENIFLNGAILGMKSKEIRAKFDAIVDFSGVEMFLDTPLKHYSSGMQLRLAFAVAAFLENEVLIIDEVLAVGDAEFQKKCMGKMGEVSLNDGRTILVVSHDLNAIANLTSRSLLLDRGKVIRFDRTEDVIVQYAKREQVESTFTRDVVTTRQPKIKSVRIHTSLPGNIHKFGQALTIEVELYTPVKPANVTWMSIFVRDQQNKPITQVWTSSQDTPSLCADTGTSRVICTLPESKLYMGHYDLSVYLSGPPDTEQYDSVEHVCPFEVVMYGKERAWKWDPGMATYLEESRWEVADSSASSEGV
jgi:lipopolysaccharide transport system ATP-binding protein